MQSVLSRNWTRIALSISCDDNHYTTDTSKTKLYLIVILTSGDLECVEYLFISIPLWSTLTQSKWSTLTQSGCTCWSLLELSAEIVPNICARFVEANHRTTSSFLRDGVSCDLSKDAIYIWRPICIHPFYQLIKLVYTGAYRSLPQILDYHYFKLTLWVVLQCKL